MKKIILLGLGLIAFNAQSQEISKNALGLRFGSNDGFGTEISYQRGLSSENRLEIDLGWRNNDNINGYKLVGAYQWVWNIDGGFNWYAGPAAGLGTWKYDHRDVKADGTYLLVGGQLGIEYNFPEFPIQISLDIRPEFYIGDGIKGDNFGPDFALGIRYKF